MILKLNILEYGIDMEEALQGLKLIDLTRVRSGPSAVRPVSYTHLTLPTKA